MKTLITACLAVVSLLTLQVQAQNTTVWNPAANPATTGLWSESANWTGNAVPGTGDKAVFNVAGAIPCVINSPANVGQLVMGDGGPGTLIVTNGGSLATGTIWTGLGYNNQASLEVYSGGTAVFNEHLWIGFEATGDGTLTMHGGTIRVMGMFGLGWNGGKGTAQIYGGTLNLSQWHPTDSIKGTSKMDITRGQVVITGNVVSSIDSFVSAGKITAYGGASTIVSAFDATENKTTVTATKPPNVGPFPADNWPTTIDPAKTVHYFVVDNALEAPNPNWNPSISIGSGGDQATVNTSAKGFTALKATSTYVNIADSAFYEWNISPTIDILVQVYGDDTLMIPPELATARVWRFREGTTGVPGCPTGPGSGPTVNGAPLPTENLHNFKWNWILFQITNQPIIICATNDTGNRRVGFVPEGSTGNTNNGGVNGGTIRLGAVNPANWTGLIFRAVAFGEAGAFGTPENINQFEPPDAVACDPVPDTNLAGVDYHAGVTNYLQVMNDSDQTVNFLASVGPSSDLRKAVIPLGQYLNFGILSNYLGEPCNPNVTIKVCVDFYDDPIFVGQGVQFGPEAYATDGTGVNPPEIYPATGLFVLQGTGQWIRKSWTISGVNLLGVNTAPLTGGPRFICVGASVAVSRFYVAVLRTTGPLAGQDPLADCYADPLICQGAYGNYAELDLAKDIKNGLDVGDNSGDQTTVIETAGPAGDQRLSVRGNSLPSYYVNFVILTNALGPTSQGNVHLAITVTYYDDPALAGQGFRPQVWKKESGGLVNFAFFDAPQNLILQGTDTWRDAYWEIGAVHLSGVNQSPQAAARFEMGGPIHISRVQYAVIRPCGPTAGVNLLENKVRITSAPETNAMVRLTWPYQAPQAALQGLPAVGANWSNFPGTPVLEGGGLSVLRFSPTNSSQQFFRLLITPP
jgi:hypothetical protein